MGLYERHILPRLIDLAMRQRLFDGHRRRTVANAHGRVLEVGVGSGLNMSLYPEGVTDVIGLDPSHQLLMLTRERDRARAAWVGLVEGSAEAIPLATDSVDTVLTTWTLCSIPDVQAALRDMHRVLAPSGQLLFVEHGRSPDPSVCGWQDRLTPVWKRVAGGCHLNRPIVELLEGAGFRIERLEKGYIKGPRPMTFMYEGMARPSEGPGENEPA